MCDKVETLRKMRRPTGGKQKKRKLRNNSMKFPRTEGHLFLGWKIERAHECGGWKQIQSKTQQLQKTRNKLTNFRLEKIFTEGRRIKWFWIWTLNAEKEAPTFWNITVARSSYQFNVRDNKTIFGRTKSRCPPRNQRDKEKHGVKENRDPTQDRDQENF